MLRPSGTLLLLAAILLLAPTSGRAAPPVLGMVADQESRSVTVFDANNDVVLGSVELPQSPLTSFATGDVEILADHSLGFVTDFRFRIWVIDLQTSPPSLAGGVNPIVVSNQAEDLVISNDQRYLIACDGSNAQPVSVVDLATRTEINAQQIGVNSNAIDICPDDSLLVSSVTLLNTGVRRVLLGGDGSLTDTGEFLINGTNNVYCVPGGMVGLKVRGGARSIDSFTVPGLSLVQIRSLFGTYGLCASFSPDGTWVCARSQSQGNNQSWLEVFPLNPVTGAIGTVLVRRQVGAGGGPDVTNPAVASGYFGMDQLATHPSEARLYVPESSQTPGVVTPAVRIYEPTTLDLLGEITAPAMMRPTGVKLVARASVEFLIDIKPGSATNSVNLKSKGQLPVAVLTTDTFDALDVDVTTLLLGDPELVALGASPVPPSHSAIDDVDGDGDDDLILHFSVAELVAAGAIDADSVGLVLTGNALDGTPLFGGDGVTVK